MYTGWVWGITMLIVGAVVALAALQVVSAALFPVAAESARRRAALGAGANVLAAFAGAVALTAVVLLVALVANIPAAGPLLAVVLGSAAALGLGTGLAGVSSEIGRRMAGDAGAADRPWRQILRGAVAVELAGLVPVVGWAMLVLVWLPVGAGAFVMSRFAARSALGAPVAA